MTHNAYTTKGYMTYREIAEVLGVSAWYVRVIEQRALRKLSHPKNRERLQALIETLGEMEEERARALGWTKDFKGGVND